MTYKITKELFGVLACPLCKADLKYTDNKKNLICIKCNSKYPIKNGVPILLPPKKKDQILKDEIK